MASIMFGALSGLAAAGLVLSVVAHVLALLGTRLPMQGVLVLHAGVFVVWVPFVVAGIVLRRSGTAVAFPSWWRSTLKWSLAYVALHFMIAVVAMLTERDTPVDVSSAPALVGRVFSAAWMLFYGTATIGLAVYRRSIMPTQSGESRPTRR